MYHLIIWHFSPIFVLFKLTYLVTLFDHNLQFQKALKILRISFEV